MGELYISIDVETDGPIPGPNSMLSLGAVALTPRGVNLGEFEINFEELEGASGNPDTMAWWAKQPKEIWDACRREPKHPQVAMRQFASWINDLAEEHHLTPVCVAYPAGFDFMFVYWYLMRFLGKSPFSFSCLDIKTNTMATLKLPYRQSTKKNMPREWFKDLPPHEHIACSDAREQGLLFLNILRHNVHR
jgi:hypothetical protein